MKCFCIRHLETSWNQKGILQGSCDQSILLPNEPVLMAIQSLKRTKLDTEGIFDQVLVSQLLRTQQTAIQYGYQKFEVEPLINELNFGLYEGQPKRKMHQDLGRRWFDEPASIVLGETLSNFELRVKLFIEKYASFDKLLIFAHGSWTRALVSISECGSINNMNRITVNNNQLVILNF